MRDARRDGADYWLRYRRRAGRGESVGEAVQERAGAADARVRGGGPGAERARLLEPVLRRVGRAAEEDARRD